MVTGGLILGGECTVQYTDNVLENCTLETCITFLTNVNPINSIKIKKHILFNAINILARISAYF